DGGAGAPAYAVRAEAEKALGRPAAQVQADLTLAASLDPGLAALYRQAVDRIAGPGGAAASGAGGPEASGGGYGMTGRIPPSWLALAALAGGLLAAVAGFALWVKRRTQKAFESGDPPPLHRR
ncbi:MAG: hypothetical protein KGM24_08585, partial [Elusimicrobia bacterium]|nr:hypothetical protein [Elusimicrobiota bacterium]